MAFILDPVFDASSLFVVDWPICQVRLQDDARFPWLILLPRVVGAVELEDLSILDRAALMEEAVRASELVRRLGAAMNRPIEKLNVAALGNVTPQLHVHVIGRRRDDAAWPNPVWGRGEAAPYAPDDLTAALATLRSQSA